MSTRRAEGAFVGWLLSLPFRYALGMPMVGENPTDSSFWSDGTGWAPGRKGSFFRREPSKRQLMAGWKRALWRDVPVAVVVGGWFAWTYAPVLTCVVVGLVLGLLFELAVRRHELSDHLEKVDALHESLACAIGWDSSVKARHWLHVPVNYRDPDAVIRCDLPVKLYVGDDEESVFRSSSSVRQQINTFVFQRLGLNASEMTASYHLAGADPHVEYAHLPRVPNKVGLKDIEAALEEVGGAELVLGLGRGGQVVTIDIDDDSPHIMQSVGSGGGKSVQIALMAAQVLARDGRVIILDPKGTSHRWALHHPNVIYARSMREIHEALMGLGAEMTRRQVAAREDEHAIDACPRVLVVVEERNALMEQLTPWWEEYVEEQKAAAKEAGVDVPALPKKCPSVSVLRNISFMGREPRLHLLSAAQQATAQTMGGGASRESYAARIMGRNTTPATWDFLAKGLTPRATDRKGRFFLAMHGLNVTEFQGAHLSAKELRKLSLSCFENEAELEAAKARPAELFYREPGVVVGEVVEPVTVPDMAAESVPASPSAGLPVPAESPVPATSTSGVDLRKHVGTVPGEDATGTDAMPLSRDGVLASNPDSASEFSRENVIQFERPVTLKEAAEQGITERSEAALKKAAQRSPGFPAPAGKRGRANVYKPSELRLFEANNPAATRKPAPKSEEEIG